MTVAFALTTIVGLYAQGVTTASISGLVTDKNGEPLPGASVIAIHTPSGTKYGAVSRSDGRYNLPAVRIGGPYTVTVTFVGYEDQKTEIDYLALDQNFTANFKLGESAIQLSEIQVTAQKDAVLNSERTGAATSVRREQFERLPSITRSFQDFTALDPRSNGFSFGGRSNLFNNFTIDGATSNNVFGLSALPGGQANSQPISVDAIQAIQVNFAPYDVRQGAFTGAGVNAVTRSGTNEFSGSAYGFFKNQSMVGTKVAGVTQTNANFSYENVGFRLGGPIIKNKLFFFANYEFEKNVTPAVTFPANTTGNQPLGITDTADPNYNSEANLQRISDFFSNPANASITGGYNPGSYKNFDLPTQSQKYLARFDWNISDKHKLTVRYNQLSAFRDITPSGSVNPFGTSIGGRTNSVNGIPFSNSYYRQLNTLYSIVAELNSSFSNKYSNTFTIGYSAFRDPREQGGGGAVPAFPMVDIKGPNGQWLTSIGPDPFTKNNKLYQDIIQINDNFNIYLPNHVVTLGTANELFKFTNVFTAMINGNYQFNSISDFLNNAVAPTATNAPTQFQTQYSAVAGNPAPGAIWNAQQFGVYAQDEYTGIKNVKLTYGIRVDMPSYPSTLPQNTISDALTFNHGEKIQVGKLPNATVLYSPRIGFNWDVKGDKTLQVRGGTGVFTGRIPFVWLSNQVTNNGLLFGQIQSAGQAANFASGYNFSATPVTSTGAAPQFSINATVKNFKFPQVWRTNIAIDKSLPYGLVATFEAIYTKDINAAYWRDANLSDPIRTVDGDGRPQFAATINSNPTAGATDANGNPLYGRRINQNIVSALVLDNTKLGYSYSLTGQLQKTFNKGFYASAAYTFTDARDVNAGTGSQASVTSYPTVQSYNLPIISYSSNLAQHRVVASASYRKEYARFFATTLSAIYQGSSGFRYSYTYTGDVNGDGSTNDLIYIPRNQSEILLTTSNAADTRSVVDIWNQLDQYISQDKYLSKHRGEYAARNGAVSPWTNSLNVRLLQDFYIELKNGKRNTLQFSFEAINFLNLLNSDWGVTKIPARQALLGFAGYENPGVTTPNTNASNPLLPNSSYTTTAFTGRPIFTFATNSDGSALSRTNINNTTIGSRYQLQIGVRYIFN
ncbi:MAG: TonB-dependent receptor [Bacteroidetes bacterium]|nr:TonB-dependent receptor [Bacteroidota bacterium]